MSNLNKSLVITTALVGLALTAGPALAVDPVSAGASPFAGCNISGEAGISYVNAEVEPWVDVNPVNPNNLVAGWQQDRWSNGGARSLMFGTSFDGGATWTKGEIPGLTKCSLVLPSTYDRATDPWVSFSPNGVAYFMSLTFNNDLPTGSVGANSMQVSRSFDGGLNWTAPVPVSYNNDGQSFDDKNSITADPTDSKYVYAVWDRLVDFSIPPLGSGKEGGAGSGAPYRGDGVAAARQRLRTAQTLGPITNSTIWTGPTYLARSTDGGESWEPARKIFDTGSNDQTIGNIVEVLPNGRVINFFTHLSTLGWGGVKLGMIRSTDKGATWSTASYVSQMVETSTGTLTPNNKEPVRDGNILFDSAVDRINGNIYLVWQDGRYRNIDTVFFSMSTNSGNSWSKPVRINKTPYSGNKLRNQAFVPSVVVGAEHKVYVTYYDFRNDTNEAGKELTDFWSITCDIEAGANCRTAGGWGNEQRLLPASFNMLNAPVARGHFLGDYMGLVRQGDEVRSVFGVATTPDVSDIVSVGIP